jgi:hypothetical protein
VVLYNLFTSKLKNYQNLKKKTILLSRDEEFRVTGQIHLSDMVGLFVWLYFSLSMLVFKQLELDDDI